MAIELRVVKTEQEIDHALWVRHEVFVIEDGKFGGKPLPGERILDRFDAFPGVKNIVAYEEVEPIATIRIVKQTSLGLPVDEYYDFKDYRKRARDELRQHHGDAREPVFMTAGMLAVRKPWRVRRDVIRAMFKVAASVCMSLGVSHILLAVNHETAGMYRRLGFKTLKDKMWVEQVGNHITPLAAPVEDFYAWAFEDLPETALDIFKDSFERLFLRQGETVFSQGEVGDRAYIVDTGVVRISKHTANGEELTLPQMKRGDLFGELALIDDGPRSATATAASDAELITLSRDAFQAGLEANPASIKAVLGVFARRLRRMDDFAMMLAFAPERQRLEFALQMARNCAMPDRRHPTQRVYRGSVDDLATAVAMPAEIMKNYLDECRERGELEYTARQVRFLR